MTCYVCKYEFCWACGASAASGDNHFEGFNGCGVRMMDDTVKAGKYATAIDESEEEGSGKRRCKCSRCPCSCSPFRWLIGCCRSISRDCCGDWVKILALIIFFPLVCLFYFPTVAVMAFWSEQRYQYRRSCGCKILLSMLYFLFIFLIQLPVVPLLVIWGLLFFIYRLWFFLIRTGLTKILCCCCYLCLWCH